MNKRRLCFFIVVALLCGWFGVGVDKILTEQPEGSTLGMLLWLVIPFFAAIIMRLCQNDWENNGFAPHFRGNMKWYGFAFNIPIVVGVISVAFGAVTKSISFDLPSIAALPSIILWAVFGQFLKNVFEEYAWRGYLTQKLAETNLKDGMIYMVVGIVWATWHVPYYLFYLDESLLAGSSRGMLILSGYIILTSWSIMYVELYRITKSIWPCVIMHAISNVVQGMFFGAEGGIKFTSGAMEVLFHPVSGVIATLICILSGLLLRHYRILQCKDI